MLADPVSGSLKMGQRRRYKYRVVAVGGTFDILHNGHKALLGKAFQVGKSVLIGLSTNRLIEMMRKKHAPAPYRDRYRALRKFLEEEGVADRTKIVPLNDPYGMAAIAPSIEALVVSEETRARGIEVNQIRRSNGLRLLDLVEVDLILAENGKPISTSRIRAGEITVDGRMRRVAER